MLINRDHRRWAIASAAVTTAGAASYVAYVSGRPYGPSGGSWMGLFYGVVGTTFMVLAGLLAARKKLRTWRLGSAQSWMRVHIWLSLLAVPFILFHAGFRLGGPLTTWLMVLFGLVTLSGIVGLALQQFVPSLMTSRVPLETLHSQMQHVGEGLALSAYETVAAVTGALPEAVEEQKRLADEAAVQASRPGYWKKTSREDPAETPAPEAERLRDLYLQQVRPYLRRSLPTAGAASAAPRDMPDVGRALLDAPEEWSPRIEKLAALCEESRQLEVQMRLHRWLHGWLFVHAPLSFALFVLTAFHVWYALSYKPGG
ncbi:MAG: hypothetical protein AB1689_11750 [Thermodesulfobacteriota bacterium]